MPDRLAGERKSTFQPKRDEGIFVGYHTNALGVFTGDYEVVPLGKLREDGIGGKLTEQKVTVFPVRTESVFVPDVWQFPLREQVYREKWGFDRLPSPKAASRPKEVEADVPDFLSSRPPLS